MGKPERNPVDYDSWQEWQDRLRRDGKMPMAAKPVPYVIVGILLALVVTWLVLDRVGGTLDDARRTGYAVLVEECRSTGAPSYRCSAEVTWSGGSTDRAEVLSAEPISGKVEVEERQSFQAGRRGRSSTNELQVWATGHTPDARPWLFPVVFGGVGVLSLGIGGVVIAKGSTWLERRSRQEWSRARQAAGKSW